MPSSSSLRSRGSLVSADEDPSRKSTSTPFGLSPNHARREENGIGGGRTSLTSLINPSGVVEFAVVSASLSTSPRLLTRSP
eukprot:CAMPEP_0183307820 /NCGR_PEP_ID=MMETSP0160_2-20130417/19566_1 /TAXON_ID=2839 ORGANISM="Odontella Sinensis, Strain Grunow 1884" /NCGR_SAMPLE_ID=MMETSP0160_2 /ASSEMBLY_ACC=CAM_ASM_000250 /LENGTH=80 /DNA_ID=CAMNT_0025471497 /DNA_START=549 /DNA_END=788 /DNA_ORIENTATION=-